MARSSHTVICVTSGVIVTCWANAADGWIKRVGLAGGFTMQPACTTLGTGQTGLPKLPRECHAVLRERRYPDPL
jgi:hypothetical protein